MRLHLKYKVRSSGNPASTMSSLVGARAPTVTGNSFVNSPQQSSAGLFTAAELREEKSTHRDQATAMSDVLSTSAPAPAKPLPLALGRRSCSLGRWIWARSLANLPAAVSQMRKGKEKQRQRKGLFKTELVFNGCNMPCLTWRTNQPTTVGRRITSLKLPKRPASYSHLTS